MAGWMRSVASECYQIRRAILFRIHLLVPFLGIGLFVFYDRHLSWSAEAKMAAYFQVLAVAFPLLIGIITAFSAEQEAQAGAFQNMLSAPSKSLAHLSKLTALLTYGLAASLLTVLGVGVIFRAKGHVFMSLFDYGQGALILFLSMLPLYILHHLVAFALGKSAGTMMGIAGSLFSALLLTGLGDGLWAYLPWGLSARASGIFVAGKGPEPLRFVYADVSKGMVCFLFFSLALLTTLLIWGHKWEGRANIDD